MLGGGNEAGVETIGLDFLELSLGPVVSGHLGEANSQVRMSGVGILRGSIEHNIVILKKDVADVPSIGGLLLLIVVHDSEVALVVTVPKG